jgi:uncharacterized protein (DUF1697 family)
MPTCIVLLRAVNVGGTGKLAMADFRQVLADLGYRNIQTYIQSGNAVFDAKGAPAKVSRDIAAALEKRVGRPIDVVVRTREELALIIESNPFAAEAAADGARVAVAFLATAAPASAKAGLDDIVTRYPTRHDRYHLAGDTLYLHLPDGAADTKFAGKPLERALGGVMGTARNWNTVVKLLEMANGGSRE